MWHPRVADLNGYAHGLMESAYEKRGRARCSRDDFFDGYMAALRDLRARSMFAPGCYEAGSFEPGRTPSEPRSFDL